LALIFSGRICVGEEMPKGLISTPEFLTALVLTIAALGLLVYQKMKQRPIILRPAEWVFIVFVVLFYLGYRSPFVVIWINLLTLLVAILTIREGAMRNHFGILNYGLLIITGLIVCRFFDVNIDFVLKGILFVLVGLGFFFANMWMMKRKKKMVTTPGS
jgi:hypothetical protein